MSKFLEKWPDVCVVYIFVFIKKEIIRSLILEIRKCKTIDFMLYINRNFLKSFSAIISVIFHIIYCLHSSFILIFCCYSL